MKSLMIGIWLIVAMIMMIIAAFQPTKVDVMLYLIFGMEFLILAKIEK